LKQVSRWSARTHYLCIRQHVHLCEICQAVGCNQAGCLSTGRQVVGTRILYVHGIEALGGAERDLISLLKTLIGHVDLWFQGLVHSGISSWHCCPTSRAQPSSLEKVCSPAPMVRRLEALEQRSGHDYVNDICGCPTPEGYRESCPIRSP
jgi:hypothetical protein